MSRIIALLVLGFVVYRLASAWLRPAAMSPGDAARLLGIAADADSQSVIDAHRRLIARVHPDVGGTDELAARINRARDVMLDRRP